MPDRLVEMLARHLPDELLLVADQDPALAVALAQHHRRADGVVGADEARGAGHDLRGRPQRPGRPRQRGEDALPRLGEGAVVDGGGRLRVPAAAECRRDRSRVELGDARAHDAEDAAVHLDEADERPRVGEVDDLVREIGDAVDVLRPGYGGDEHLQALDGVGLERRDERVEQRPLLLGERRAQVLRDHVLTGAVAQAPGERLRVAEADARVAERAGVLVDPEREDRRLERRDVDLALGEDAHHASSSARRPPRGRGSRAGPSRPPRRCGGRRRRPPRRGRARRARTRPGAPGARSRRRRAAGSSPGRCGRPRADPARRRAGGRTRARSGSASRRARSPRPGTAAARPAWRRARRSPCSCGRR